MRLKPSSLLIGAAYIAIQMAASLGQAEGSGEETLVYKPRRLLEPQPAIVDAPFISADQVVDEVSDNELVLGVVVNGEARAYPINQLTGPRREIINDRLGQQDIAATW